MAQFNYKARKANGELATGVLEGADASSVAQILVGRSFTPIEITQASQKQTAETSKISFFTPKITIDDLVIFSRQKFERF